MSERSLFNQFRQIRGTRNFQDLKAYINLAELVGNHYLVGTLTVVSGSSTVTDSSNPFGRDEKNNFIVVETGPAAEVYQIVDGDGGFTAVVDPIPIANDTIAYRRHYYGNLESDLNYLRSILDLIIGEDDWRAPPSTTLAEMYNYMSTSVSGQGSFLGLSDTIDSYNSGRILFTTDSGIVDDPAFTFDPLTDLLNVAQIQLGAGEIVNEVVSTITSGSTNNQVPTAKAVWDMTETDAVTHTHYDVDCTYVSDNSWTYGSNFSEVPDNLVVYVNGMKNRLGSDNDYTADVPGGALVLTFNYNVESDFWVNISYTS